MKPSILIALVLAGCTSQSLPIAANVSQPMTAPITPAQHAHGRCRVLDDGVQYTWFAKHKFLYIHGLTDYRFAQSADVYNDLSNGARIRDGEHKPTYVPGNGYGGWHELTFVGRAHSVVVEPVVRHPASGWVKLNITWCQLP